MEVNGNIPIDRPTQDDVNKTDKNKTIVGKGSLGHPKTIKYTEKHEQLDTNNKLKTQPIIEKPLPKQNFTLAKQQVEDAEKLLKSLNIDKESFLKEINSGKISKDTQNKLQKNIGYLQSTKNYMEYLSGKNLDSEFAKSSILSGMDLNGNQQKIALLSLNKQKQLDFIYKTHGGKDNVNTQLKLLQSVGYNKQQALSILSFAPTNNLNVSLKGTKTQKALEQLGFDKQQVDNLIKLLENKTTESPNNKNLLNKAGFDNDTVGILQALGNKKALSTQEVMIKNSNEYSLLVLDDMIEGFDTIKNNKPTRNNEYSNSMALYYSLLEIIHKSQVERKELERNSQFKQGMAAVNEKSKQADLEREAGYKEFVGSMVQSSVRFAASAAQMKIASSGATGAQLQAAVAKSNAISGMMNSMGDVTKAVYSFEATKSRAEIKDSEAQEKLHDIYYREAGEYIQNMISNSEDIVRKMQDVEKTTADTQNSINRFS